MSFHPPLFLQDLLPPCCFLLVAPEGKNFLWIGNAFAENFAQVRVVIIYSSCLFFPPSPPKPKKRTLFSSLLLFSRNPGIRLREEMHRDCHIYSVDISKCSYRVSKSILERRADTRLAYCLPSCGGVFGGAFAYGAIYAFYFLPALLRVHVDGHFVPPKEAVAP